MSDFKPVSRFFSRKGPKDIQCFVSKNMDITEQVYALLAEKGWSQKDLAGALGKTDAEVSRWLSGTHNLTLRSIAKLEAVLDADLILTPLKAADRYKEIAYVTVRVDQGRNQMYHEPLEYRPAASRKKVKGQGDLRIEVA